MDWLSLTWMPSNSLETHQKESASISARISSPTWLTVQSFTLPSVGWGLILAKIPVQNKPIKMDRAIFTLTHEPWEEDSEEWGYQVIDTLDISTGRVPNGPDVQYSF